MPAQPRLRGQSPQARTLGRGSDLSQNSSGGPVGAEICPCSVAGPCGGPAVASSGMALSPPQSTVPSPGHCHLFPFPPPAPRLSPHPPGHAGSAEAEGDVSPVPFPARSCSQCCHCFVQGVVSRLGWQRCSTGAVSGTPSALQTPGFPVDPSGNSQCSPKPWVHLRICLGLRCPPKPWIPYRSIWGLPVH